METQKIATGFFKNTLSKKHFRIEKFHQSLSYIHLIRNTKNSSKRWDITNINKTVSAYPFPAPKNHDDQVSLVLFTIIPWRSSYSMQINPRVD